MAIDLGDVYRLSYRNTAPDGSLINAASVSGTVTLPDGTGSVFGPVTPTGLGIYFYDFTTTQVGRHVARWVATGTGAGSTSEMFDVRPGDPGYLISLTDAKRALNMDVADTSNDEEIRALLEGVTATVENYRGETIVRRTVTEYVSGRRQVTRRRLVLTRPPVISLTSVIRPYDAFTWAATDAILVDPNSGIIVSYGTPFYGDMVVTYLAGYAVIPGNYVEAAKIILRHLWETQQTPGMASPVFGSGGSDVTPGIAGMGYAIPNRAAELLGGRGPMIA